MAVKSNASSQDQPAQQGPGLMGLIKAVAFITVIVIVEVVAASLFIPSAKETEDLGKQLITAGKGEVANDAGESPTDYKTGRSRDVDIREVLIGTYHVTHYRPESRMTLTIDIEVHGSVLASEEEEFKSRFEKNKGRVGEQIIMTLHAAETKDLTDAGLGLIKRKILEKTNRALGKPLVREVLFSMFNFVER